MSTGTFLLQKLRILIDLGSTLRKQFVWSLLPMVNLTDHVLMTQCTTYFIIHFRILEHVNYCRTIFVVNKNSWKCIQWTSYGPIKRIQTLLDLPVQLNPSPVYPSEQVHVKLPGVLLQTATASQPPSFDEHSSISTPADVLIRL